MSDAPLIYLDNNATTRPAPEVVEAMLPFLTEQWGNPSSMHAFGGRVAKPVAEAREQVAAFLNAERPEEVVFEGCATEADNHALFGVAAAWGRPGTIITSRVEHPAILGPCLRLREMGHTVVEIGVDGEGRFDMEAYEAALAAHPGPKLVSVMWANNETGVLFPIKRIAELGKAAGATVHTDAVQAAGKVPLDVREVPVDLLSIAGHKMHAPHAYQALRHRGSPGAWPPRRYGECALHHRHGQGVRVVGGGVDGRLRGAHPQSARQVASGVAGDVPGQPRERRRG